MGYLACAANDEYIRADRRNELQIEFARLRVLFMVSRSNLSKSRFAILLRATARNTRVDLDYVECDTSRYYLGNIEYRKGSRWQRSLVRDTIERERERDERLRGIINNKRGREGFPRAVSSRRRPDVLTFTRALR